jgi:hypothetical protein
VQSENEGEADVEEEVVDANCVPVEGPGVQEDVQYLTSIVYVGVGLMGNAADTVIVYELSYVAVDGTVSDIVGAPLHTTVTQLEIVGGDVDFTFQYEVLPITVGA